MIEYLSVSDYYFLQLTRFNITAKGIGSARQQSALLASASPRTNARTLHTDFPSQRPMTDVNVANDNLNTRSDNNFLYLL